MGRERVILLPQQVNRLKRMGGQIRLARLRRKLSIEIVAERAGITRQTVAALEKGSPSVSIGIVVNVLNAMRLQDDILLLAKDDVLGRTLQDLDVKIHKRAPKRQRMKKNEIYPLSMGGIYTGGKA